MFPFRSEFNGAGECVHLATTSVASLPSLYDLSAGAVDGVCNSFSKDSCCRCLKSKKKKCSNRWCEKYNGRCLLPSDKVPTGWKKWIACDKRQQCYCYTPPCVDDGCTEAGGKCLALGDRPPAGSVQVPNACKFPCKCWKPATDCEQTEKCKDPSGVYPGGECSQVPVLGSVTATNDCLDNCRCWRPRCTQTRSCQQARGWCVGKNAPLTSGQVVADARCREGCKCVAPRCVGPACIQLS